MLIIFAGKFYIQYRSKSKRNQCRNQYRTRYHYAKLAEKSTGKAFEENHRHEYYCQSQRSRNDGKENFPRALDCGFHDRHTFFYSLENIFRYHNTVIDHQAGRKDNSEQSQHIYRKTENIHHEERPDQRNRNIQQRAECNFPISEKYKNNP